MMSGLALLAACGVNLWAQSYDEQLARVRAAINENRYADAADAAEQAIKLDDKRWDAYVLAASAYSSQRLFDDAIGMLQMALPRAPENVKPLIRDALANARKQLAAPAVAQPTVPSASPQEAIRPRVDPIDSSAANVNADLVVQKFAAKEAEFSRARDTCTYRQIVKLQILDANGKPTPGQLQLLSDIIFAPGRMMYNFPSRAEDGWSPVVTRQDEQELRKEWPFVLTTRDLPDYNITYLGREKLDDIGTLTFSVTPKKPSGRSYFEGRVWVDDRDLQIVKSDGKNVGEIKKVDGLQFASFETYREQIDGKYWFPTYTSGGATLHSKDQDIRVRMTVSYLGYKCDESRLMTNNADATGPTTNNADATDGDPSVIPEASQSPQGGFLGQLLGALAQVPVPQTRIPQQTASAPPTQPAPPIPTQSRYPGSQQGGRGTTQQQPGVQTAGGAASQRQPQYPGGQTAGGATSQQQPQNPGGQQSGAGGGTSDSSGIPAAQCVSVQTSPESRAVWGFANRCNYRIYVRFCVQNQKSSLSCQSDTQGGLTDVQPNGFEYALPFYEDQGRGQVFFAACVAPAVPANWQHNTTTPYTCR